MTPLDPWDDAAEIARRLAQPGAELVVVIGAESWCQRCRVLRPAFDRWVQSTPSPLQLALWLDLEDHSDFLNGFIPEDLPLLLHHREGQLIQAGTLRGLGEAGWQFDECEAVPQTSIWQELITANWA